MRSGALLLELLFDEKVFVLVIPFLFAVRFLLVGVCFAAIGIGFFVSCEVCFGEEAFYIME